MADSERVCKCCTACLHESYNLDDMLTMQIQFFRTSSESRKSFQDPFPVAERSLLFIYTERTRN